MLEPTSMQLLEGRDADAAGGRWINPYNLVRQRQFTLAAPMALYWDDLTAWQNHVGTTSPQHPWVKSICSRYFVGSFRKIH